MSERADALRAVLANELPEAWNGLKWEQHEVGHYFRSICEHLGITWEDVDALRSEVGDGLRMEPTPIKGKERIWEIADALATLLEAAGIER